MIASTQITNSEVFGIAVLAFKVAVMQIEEALINDR